MGVYIQGGYATQGPCPDGFHVPLSSERNDVKNIRTALGGGSSAGTNFGIALKLSFAGYRSNSSAGVNKQGTYGYYWSSSRYNADYAYLLNFSSSTLSLQSYYFRASGCSVRCFKNSPTVPTSSWTKLYGTSIEAGGIFWSSTDGLISLSSDGQTWITIADKNLGATTVWNSGNTLSEANCGKYYQWGNNYGFAWTGSIATSSTKVDASNYGPGNYYSSSTFITISGTPYRWDTTDNGNLRGGEDGNVPAMSELKNAYIGEVWTPGANTLLYYSFNNDTASISYDGSGNNYNGTWNNNTGTYQTVSGTNKCCQLTATSGKYMRIPTSLNYPTANFTFSFWVKYTQNTNYSKPVFSKWNGSGSSNAYLYIYQISGKIGVAI